MGYRCRGKWFRRLCRDVPGFEGQKEIRFTAWELVDDSSHIMVGFRSTACWNDQVSEQSTSFGVPSGSRSPSQRVSQISLANLFAYSVALVVSREIRFLSLRFKRCFFQHFGKLRRASHMCRRRASMHGVVVEV